MSTNQPEALRLARDACEAWALSKSYGIRRDPLRPDEYEFPPTANRWEAWQAATAAEREACALVCEAEAVAGLNEYRWLRRELAAAIRARSK